MTLPNARCVRAYLFTICLALSIVLCPASTGRAAPALDGLPPLPSRGIFVAADISASVPLSLAAATRRLIVRSLEHAYSPDALAQGVPDTLFEWIAIGLDSYSPSAVRLQAWIPGVHPQPQNPFVSQHLRQQIAQLISVERRATLAAVHTVIARLNALQFHTEYGTDLDGAPVRVIVDGSAVTGPFTLVFVSDLLGAAPESNGIHWHMDHAKVVAFQFCSQSKVDDPLHCQRRRQLWEGAFHNGGATTTWYSSDNLETLPYVTFLGGALP